MRMFTLLLCLILAGCRAETEVKHTAKTGCDCGSGDVCTCGPACQCK
jgi:hypothetical protein